MAVVEEGGERCPLLPPPPPPLVPLFEFKCFSVCVCFISPDEHISSKWILILQPSICFIYHYLYYHFYYHLAVINQLPYSLFCVSVWMYRDHLFLARCSIHPSRVHIPNISAHCLKVQRKSLITHSPIGSCLRVIERVAAVALTFLQPPPPTGMPVCWYEWAVGRLYMCCAAAGTRLMKRSRRIVVVGGWVGG